MLQQVTAEVQPRLAAQVNSAVSLMSTCIVNATAQVSSSITTAHYVLNKDVDPKPAVTVCCAGYLY